MLHAIFFITESLLNVKVYTALHSPDVICVLCGFASTSEAQGCLVTLQKETNINQNDDITMPSTASVFNFSASKTGVTEAVDCLSDLSAGNYTVKVQEIECTGGTGLREFLCTNVMISIRNNDMERVQEGTRDEYI